ncbi:hypothetical protein [Microcystis aeruginosa]|uniref:hypothetical protein n=1 Tax=Microcystis aeruginosa TaxID=1126 RepID=UPI000ADB3C66|nr:hypothetical protein [Microcystis aeruginosa]
MQKAKGTHAKGKRQKAKGSFVLPTPYTPHPTPYTLHPTSPLPHFPDHPQDSDGELN